MPSSCHFRLLKFAAGTVVVELPQDVLRQLKAEVPRAAHVGNRLNLPASLLPSLLKTLFRKKFTLQKSLRGWQTHHGWRHAGIGDERPRDNRTGPFDPDAGAERGNVQVVPFGDLVQLQQFVRGRQRNEHASNDLVSRKV